MDSQTIELIMKDLREQTKLVNSLRHKMNESKNNIEELKKKLLEICPHKHIICYRYYGSGMHRPEYSRICKACDQYLDFDRYVNAETTENKDG